LLSTFKPRTIFTHVQLSTVPCDTQELSDSQTLELEESIRAARTRLVGGVTFFQKHGARNSASFCDAPMFNCMLIMMGCFALLSPVWFAIWQCYIREDVYSGKGLLDGDGGDCTSHN
jgi:hypothetical protein